METPKRVYGPGLGLSKGFPGTYKQGNPQESSRNNTHMLRTIRTSPESPTYSLTILFGRPALAGGCACRYLPGLCPGLGLGAYSQYPRKLTRNLKRGLNTAQVVMYGGV